MRKYRGKLKMFVWDDFLRDWTSGIAVAVAETEEEARAIIMEEAGPWTAENEFSKRHFESELSATPLVKPLQSGAYCWGGS